MLGWNIAYEFNDSDFEVCNTTTLDLFMNCFHFPIQSIISTVHVFELFFIVNVCSIYIHST